MALILVYAALWSRLRSSSCVCFVWKVQKISGESPVKINNNLVFAVGFSCSVTVQLNTPTHNTAACYISPHRVSLFNRPAAVWLVFSSSFRGFDKSWHRSMLLRVFAALKTVWYEQKNECKIRNGWVLGLERRIGNICRDAKKNLPHPFRQRSRAKNPREKHVHGGFLCSYSWNSSQWRSTVTFKKQSAVFFPFSHRGRSAWASKPTRPIRQHKQLFWATPAAEGPLERQHHDADGELIWPHAAHIWESQGATSVSVIC